jgi:hypothetical protein
MKGMMMLFVVLALALVSWLLVVAGGITDSLPIGAVGIVLSLVGLTLLVGERMWKREQREALAGADGLIQFGAHFPDYAAGAHPPHDAMVHDDHEVERDLMREEDVVHPDNGPRDYDISRVRARETIRDTHFRGGQDHGRKH